MATYYFAVAFAPDTSTDPEYDGTHYEAQYGFGLDNGSGVQPLGSSGSSGHTFEAVHVSAASNGKPNQLVVTVLTNLIGITQGQSYVRCSFRPAHDVSPSGTLPVSPLNQADTATLLSGLPLTAASSIPVNVNNGTNYGLPNNSYSTQWLFNGFNLISNQPAGTSVHFEMTFEVTVLDGGSTTYYKVDPEMMIDF